MSIVTVEEYRAITGDSSSASSAVSAKLDAAENLIEEYLQRTLAEGQYTETLEIWYEGVVYPHVTPVTAVPAEATYSIITGGTTITGVTVDSTLGFHTIPYGRSGMPDRPSHATVTYTGGFTNATLPYTLKTYLAVLARRLYVWSPDAVVGAQEISVGDIRVKYPKLESALDGLVPGMSLGLKPYKRKRLRY